MEDIQLLNHPYIQQSLQAKRSKKEEPDLEKEVKLPFVMKEKTLMAPGVWNNYYYTAEALKAAFDKTDWADKELTSLFLDHADKSAREWIGEVRNPRMVGDELKGDLFIVDKPTAMKLAFGAKLGISPKVSGEAEEGTMMNFLYDNFSVVINPAVKKAYINNSEQECACKKEEMAKELDPQAKVRNRGDVVFSAESPKVKDKQDHFPINDLDQARNALARVSQFDAVPPWFDGSLEDLMAMVREAVKKKYPDIEVSGLPEEKNMSETTETPVAQSAPVQTELQAFVQNADKYLSEKVQPVMAQLQDACAKVEEYGKIMNEMKEKLSKLEEDLAKVKDLAPSLPAVVADENKPAPEVAEQSMNEAIAETPAVAPVTQEMQQVEVTLDDAKAVPVKRSFYMSQNSATEADYGFYELLMKQ